MIPETEKCKVTSRGCGCEKPIEVKCPCPTRGGLCPYLNRPCHNPKAWEICLEGCKYHVDESKL